MITIEIMGGLGNQLFQIFALISLGLTNNIPYYFENKQITHGARKIYYWDNLLKSLKSFLKPVINTKLIHEAGFHYTPLEIKNNCKFMGYFQSYKYFEKNQEAIFKLINLEDQKKELKKDIDFDNTVSLHFRVGDYAKLPTYHPLMSTEYYIEALKQLIQDTGKNNWTVLYFCEEADINYVNEKINIIKQNIYLSNLTFTKINGLLEDWEQVLTMSLCKHNIIANSTFSWWGAYFNNNITKKVYYPKLWFGPAAGKIRLDDLFPIGWTKIIV